MESLKQKLKKNWFFFIISIVIFFLDRVSKIYIIDFFLDQKIDTFYINPYLNFVLIWNTGMAFGVLQSDSIFYHFLSAFIFCIIIFLFIWLVSSISKFEKISISLILGGAIGNLYDRIVFNAVPDFIDLHYLDYHWFVFNVSDIIITVGVILLLLKDIFSKKNV